MKIVIEGVNAYGAETSEEFHQVNKSVISKLVPTNIDIKSDIFHEEDAEISIVFEYEPTEEPT